MTGKWLRCMFLKVPGAVLYKFNDRTMTLVAFFCCQRTTVIRLLRNGIASKVILGLVGIVILAILDGQPLLFQLQYLGLLPDGYAIKLLLVD